MRHASLEKNRMNMHTKFQVENIYSDWDIYVQKIKVMKMVLNSYFLRNRAIYYNNDMIG